MTDQLERFLSILANKHEALQTLFEDIGTPEDVRVQGCQALFDQCISVADSQVTELKKSKHQLVQACDGLMEGVRSMTGLLGQGNEGIQRLVETLEGMTLWHRHRLLQDEHQYIQEVRQWTKSIKEYQVSP